MNWCLGNITCDRTNRIIFVPASPASSNKQYLQTCHCNRRTETPWWTFFFLYKFVQPFKPIYSVYGNARLQNLHIHLWNFLSFCFCLLLNKSSIADTQRNHDKQSMLSLFALITHWFNSGKSCTSHQYKGYESSRSLLIVISFSIFLILLYRFQNEYACPAYISLQAPRCLYLRFKHQFNVPPEFSFPFPRVFTSLFPFLMSFW